MNRCLVLVPNSLTRVMAYYRYITVYADDFTQYLRDMVTAGGFAAFGTRAEQLFAALSDENIDFMKAAGVGFKLLISNEKKWINIDLFTKLGQRLCRGSDDEINLFLYFYSWSDEAKAARIKSVVQELQDSSKYVYDAERAKDLTGIDIPASDRGLAPDYSRVTESVYDEQDIIYANSKKNASIKVELSGVRSYDEAAANAAAGLDATPELYVWHHLDDFDPVTGKCTMQLVLKEFHYKVVYGSALEHTGGVGVWAAFYEIAYK